MIVSVGVKLSKNVSIFFVSDLRMCNVSEATFEVHSFPSSAFPLPAFLCFKLFPFAPQLLWMCYRAIHALILPCSTIWVQV